MWGPRCCWPHESLLLAYFDFQPHFCCQACYLYVPLQAYWQGWKACLIAVESGGRVWSLTRSWAPVFLRCWEKIDHFMMEKRNKTVARLETIFGLFWYLNQGPLDPVTGLRSTAQLIASLRRDLSDPGSNPITTQNNFQKMLHVTCLNFSAVVASIRWEDNLTDKQA